MGIRCGSRTREQVCVCTRSHTRVASVLAQGLPGGVSGPYQRLPFSIPGSQELRGSEQSAEVEMRIREQGVCGSHVKPQNPTKAPVRGDTSRHATGPERQFPAHSSSRQMRTFMPPFLSLLPRALQPLQTESATRGRNQTAAWGKGAAAIGTRSVLARSRPCGARARPAVRSSLQLGPLWTGYCTD